MATKKTNEIVKKPKENGIENNAAVEARIPVTTVYDKYVYSRLEKLRRSKGEMTVQPLIRLAVSNLLDSCGF